MHIEGIALVILLGVSASAVAFEPGSERVCKPSADGQTFECRDKVTGEVDAPPETQETPVAAVASKVSAPVPATPMPAPADDHDPTAPSTRKLPNYLMQRPQSQPSAPLTTPPPAPATVEPRKAEPPPAAIVEAPKPAASPPAPAPAAAPPDKPVVREAPATRAQAPETVSKPAAAAPAPVVTPEAASSAAIPAASTDASASRNLAGAREFGRLPAGHYTLVLASVRNPAALDALALALADLPGVLYRLKLAMPDGDWYSLCWSDFTDVEAARAARNTLPSDVGITSGWPRKIGLLQKEIAR
ncbi:MAG: SPOR domain-containing protein [Dokdonella sp.]|uniref:SPOR domain-containing protein n=1 Tax=Dokdonella sp. TaxID=2291710 RepID=UPI0025C62CCE|nr:SPOR domain-containing protein [Dokdonella sp.]MBK8123226.1 SPOR domain-containing protein [Dokdonella sp.]